MNAYLRSHLGVKLFLSYLAIIVVGVVVLILASQFILPTSFNRHMAGMGMGDGNMMGMNGTGAMSQLYVDFRASFNEALIYAVLAAMGIQVSSPVFVTLMAKVLLTLNFTSP